MAFKAAFEVDMTDNRFHSLYHNGLIVIIREVCSLLFCFMSFWIVIVIVVVVMVVEDCLEDERLMPMEIYVLSLASPRLAVPRFRLCSDDDNAPT